MSPFFSGSMGVGMYFHISVYSLLFHNPQLFSLQIIFFFRERAVGSGLFCNTGLQSVGKNCDMR